MELKWSTTKNIIVAQVGSNRTFMELKYCFFVIINYLIHKF